MEHRIESLAGELLRDAQPELRELPWIMFQSWRNLLFLDWRVDEAALREVVPAAMELDTHEGQAWITMIPMHMVDVHVRDLPPVPTTSTFPEINFRTYVRVGGEAGIYFFSIDADTWIGSWIAEHFFKLPYLDASMSFANDRGRFRLTSRRPASSRAKPAEFDGSWEPTGTPARAEPGSLDHFLVERYLMFSQAEGGAVWRGRVYHRPWELQGARFEIARNTIPETLGFAAGAPDRAAYSVRADTLCWPMTPL